jgi:hypothetical protein
MESERSWAFDMGSSMTDLPEDEDAGASPDATAGASMDADERIDAEWFARRMPPRALVEELLLGDPKALLRLSRTRAPIVLGPEGDPDAMDPKAAEMLRLAKRAASKLASDPSTVLSLEELQAMHAFTHLVARPSLQVHGGVAKGVPEPWVRLDQAKDMIRARLGGVGRLDTWDEWPCGTGWLVRENRLLTNNHVVAALLGIDVHFDPGWRAKLDLAAPQANEAWAREASRRPFWDPADSPSGVSPARVTRIVTMHGALDMALLEVEGVEDGAARVLRISSAAPSELENEMVYVPGYPVVAPGLGLPQVIVDLLFGGPSASVVKRIAPGRLRGLEGSLVYHDASTLGGSSGSPVLSFATHEVVGLHFSGKYATRNYAVALWTLLDDPLFS